MEHLPTHRHFPRKKRWFMLSFYAMGIASTIWFLIRVIPKPSRATYPCMRAAFPIMSSFIIYLLTLSGSLMAFRKAFFSFKKSRYVLAGAMTVLGLVLFYTYIIHDSRVHLANAEVINPSDEPNSPMGVATGIMPGRVVWCRDTAATKNNFRSGTYFFTPENNNPIIYHKMMRESILKLTEKSNLKDAWESLFKYFNKKKKNEEVGYQAGEIIFVKVNQGTISWTCFESTGWDFNASGNKKNAGACQGNPYTILALLTQLIDSVGIPQDKIYVGDPISHIMKQHFDLWKSYYPNIKYADKSSTSVSKWGRTKINVSDQAVLHYSDKGTVMPNAVTDKIYKEMETADYMINIANLKAHVRAGITLCAKNHFGSHSRSGANHLHPSLVSPTEQESNPINNQYKQYRVFVDIMGSKYLGGNTMLFIVDGIYGGDYHELNPPRRWNMPPFNGDWCNSIFMSQDQVALESVCFDFLRTEYNGVYNSNVNPNWGAVDDYLHQAASPTEWPDGITYDPDNSGTPIGSLGVHEHWNNAVDKKYSRNLGTGQGIELVAIENQPFDTSAYIKPNRIKAVELIAQASVSPNPATDRITVRFYNKTPGICTIYLIASDGRLVSNESLSYIGEGYQQIELPLSGVHPGLYLCHVKVSNSQFVDNQTIKFYKR